MHYILECVLKLPWVHFAKFKLTNECYIFPFSQFVLLALLCLLGISLFLFILIVFIKYGGIL